MQWTEHKTQCADPLQLGPMYEILIDQRQQAGSSPNITLKHHNAQETTLPTPEEATRPPLCDQAFA